MSMSTVWVRMRHAIVHLFKDSSGIAATEFAVLVPIMLVMFFGTVEFSSGLAVDRKVTLVARTLSDLTSQSPPTTSNSPSSGVNDTYLQNVFTASVAILQSYCATPTQATLSEIYIDSNQVAKIQWSKAATFATCTSPATLTTSAHNAGDIVTVPPALLVRQTYLILSEVSYLYTPTVGYVMKTGVTLRDTAYTRPRQVVCVVYNNTPASTCPTP